MEILDNANNSHTETTVEPLSRDIACGRNTQPVLIKGATNSLLQIVQRIY